MRDILVVSIVAVLALIALRRPTVGVMLWVWLSLMNPHRFAYGFAYDAPLSAVAAIVTFIGLLISVQKDSPFKGAPVVLFVLFTLWLTLSWRMGLSPAGDYFQWSKVIKINVMLLTALILLRTKEHIFLLVWVCALSLALLGAKGGVFTLMSGGSYKVWGPPETFIEDNNEFALALVMTIPLLRFLQTQLRSMRGRHLLTAIMVLCAVSALGSHSRGGLLAITAMALVMWWRGKNKFTSGIAIVVVGVLLVSFMPENWTERMGTIQTYDEDRSAMGRFSAWWVSWRLAFDYPFGVGFNIARPELFERYSPYPELGTPVAHSIYFQVLGHHGFVGLFLFLCIWATTWFMAQRLRKEAMQIPEAHWCAELAAMCQVSLVGYLVGGAFLSLAYFDLPYYVMATVVLARHWVHRRAWTTEVIHARSRWLRIPGVRNSVSTAPMTAVGQPHP
jgi:putative inorganic carbon (hco3(-)) transporter